MFDPEITAADQASSSVIDLDPLLTALRSFAVWDSSDCLLIAGLGEDA